MGLRILENTAGIKVRNATEGVPYNKGEMVC